jgi:NAD(P)-dependent dehydrogenase (short-subunit alcohol dehydrogenase family)
MITATGPSSTGRVALVTGGAKRLGRAIVEDLAANGFAVAVHYNSSRAAADELVQSITSGGGRSVAIRADFGAADGAERILAEVNAALGPATLLVNSASIFEKDTIGSLDRDLWRRQLEINLLQPVFLAEAFAKQLPEDAEGNVVNLLDQSIWRPTPAFFSYQVSKSALAVATTMLAQALAPRIRVNGIAPGPVLPSAYKTQEQFDRIAAALPLGHAPAVADFGRTIRYLVETPSVTGQVITLDSGQHIQAPGAAARTES